MGMPLACRAPIGLQIDYICLSQIDQMKAECTGLTHLPLQRKQNPPIRGFLFRKGEASGEACQFP